MILCVALNPALDITYEFDSPVVASTTNRARAVYVRPGGKAINIAAVLGELGHPVRVIAPLGGQVGANVRTLADQFGIVATWVPIVEQTRRTVVMWHPSTEDATTLSGPAPVVSADEWASLRDAVAAALPAEAVVIAGSVAAGLPAPAVVELVRLSHEASTPVYLDTSAPILKEAIAVGVDLIKPNRQELSAAVGHPIAPGLDAIAEAARELVGPDNATVVVASSGAEGMVVVTPDGQRFDARPPMIEGGNASGAGDAALAAIVANRTADMPWPEVLRIAAAAGALAVTQPVAGTIGDPTRLSAILARTHKR